MRSVWKQGQHVLISGSTGSGKTALSRRIQQIRIDNGGHIIVLVMKPKGDSTIREDYLDNGYVRWKAFKKRPPSWQNKVLLWPDTSKLKGDAVLDHQKEVFAEAFDELNYEGKRTVVIDEGLYACSPTFLNMADKVAMMHAIGRGDNLTCVDLMQRPSNMPLIIYGSASHAFVSQTREAGDLKRLAEMGARQSSRELADTIAANEQHDFTWIPVTPGWPPEKVNLRH
jgi:hypothetical protein